MGRTDKTESMYRRLSWVLLLVCVLLGFATLPDYGMGWDEVTRWKSGDAKVDYYSQLFSSENPMAVVQAAPNEPYPGLFDMTLSLLHRATGWDRFAMGHWQAFIFGLVGLAALWRIGWIFGGARLGFWSVVLLLLTPVFYGHWFQNPKDVPFAATYTLGLLALIEWMRRYPSLSKRGLLLAAGCCGLCMATRIAGMVLLAYGLAAVAVVTLLVLWEQRGRFELRPAVRAVVGWWIALPVLGLGAYLTLLPWWPAAHKNLLSVSGATLQRLHVSASEIPLFFRGEIMWAADAPHHYTLWMFGIKAPEVLLGGLFLLLPMAAVFLRQQLKVGLNLKAAPALTVLILGGFFPLLYLTFSAPALHNGARHFLFAFPALCVCAAWAYLELGQWIREQRPALWRGAQVLFGVLLLLPTIHLLRLHPYQYVYFNALAGGPSAAIQRYEGEYWFTSSKHAMEQLAAYVSVSPELQASERALRVFILGPWQVAEPFLPENFELGSDAATADFLILNTQMRMHEHFDGEPLFNIERMGASICEVRLVSR